MVLDGRGLDRGIPVLITWLERDGALSPDAVPALLDRIDESGLSAEEVLVEHGIREDEIVRRHAAHFHVPPAPDDAAPAQPEPPLPEAFCRKHLLVPIGAAPGVLVVAMADPSRVWFHAQMTMMTGLDIEARVAAPSRVKAWIDRLFGARA